MVEANIGRTPHKEVFKTPELLIAPPISTNVLLGRTIEEPPELPLGKSIIYFYQFKTDKGTERIGVVDLSIGAFAFNHLLLSLAPAKSFDLDTRDILNDWENIDSTPERKKRHEAMGKPWYIFDRDRLYFRNHIKKAYRSGTWTNDEQDQGLIPVIRWRTYRNKRELTFDPLDPTQDKRYVEILKRHIPDYQDGMDIRFFNPTIGYFAVCHFSPEIKGNRNNWGVRDSYSSECKNEMLIGATQVGPYAIKMEETIRKSPFYSRAEKYIRLNAQASTQI